VPSRAASLFPSRACFALAILGVGVLCGLFWATSEASARILGFSSESGQDPLVFLNSKDLNRPRSLFVDFEQPSGTGYEIEGDYGVNCFKGVRSRRVEYTIPPGFASWHDHPRKTFRRPDVCYIDAHANFKNIPRTGTIAITARGERHR
jgi:hypothetical protein